MPNFLNLFTYETQRTQRAPLPAEEFHNCLLLQPLGLYAKGSQFDKIVIPLNATFFRTVLHLENVGNHNLSDDVNTPRTVNKV